MKKVILPILLTVSIFAQAQQKKDSAKSKEIEEVVFTHLEDTERLGKTTFEELISFKTSVSEEEIQVIKNKLQTINRSLFEKEKKLNPEYKKSIEEFISQKKNELNALIEDLTKVSKELKDDISQISVKHKDTLVGSFKRTKDQAVEAWNKVRAS